MATRRCSKSDFLWEFTTSASSPPRVTQPYPALAVILSQIGNYLHRAHARVPASSGYLESAGIHILATFYTEFEKKVKEPVVGQDKRRSLETWQHLVCFVFETVQPNVSVNSFQSNKLPQFRTGDKDYETRWHRNLNMLPWTFTAGVWRLRQQKALVSSFGYFIKYAGWFNWHLRKNTEFTS